MKNVLHIAAFVLIAFLMAPPASTAQTCTDSDGDTFSIEGGACGPVDCDDTNPNVHPGAAEICDGKDTNCDGWKPSLDVDNDGDGAPACAGDCDDNNSSVYPGAPEICDGIDNNCDYILGISESDFDGDGYLLCDPVPDCDDNDASVNPGASEACGDNKDNNCNGQVDEAGCICPDADNDGFTASFCGGTDCDDSDPDVNPGAAEICDDLKDNDCNGLTDINDPGAVNCPTCTDSDNDTFYAEGGGCGTVDCDDNDANVFPGAPEICDGKDSDCDGWKPLSDADNDGDGTAGCAGDCNDNNPSIYPGAPELCDGIDNNCDYVLRTDERDSDGDGFRLCSINPDCNDFDATVSPGIPEACGDNKDNNCNGQIDEAGCICPDADNDGFTASFCGGTDCDDSDSAVNPGAVEICDDLFDNDCDGLTDKKDPDAVNCPNCTDSDNDTYYVEGGGCGPVDCDDSDPNVHPGAAEICDAKDSDCDGWKPPTDIDTDGDGVPLCANDCNDAHPDVYPGAPELCDGIDNDCNYILRIDERDIDQDGYLVCGAVPDCDDNNPFTNPSMQEWCSDNTDNNCNGLIDEAGCICPDADNDGFLALFCGGTDCDDTNATVFPGAVEECTDGLDNDCDGLTDIQDPDAVNCPACTDNDQDTYYIEGGGCGAVDCDDNDPNVHPGAVEICDGKDTNCDGWKPPSDVDNDDDGVPLCAGDCDDSDPLRFPGNLEHPLRDTCNDFIDNDCDTMVDANDPDCNGSCNAATSPKDPPHFFDLLNPDDTIHTDSSSLICGKCHSADFRDPIRYACQRCHAAPTPEPGDLNGTLKELYPLDVPYGYGSAPDVSMHVQWSLGDKGCVTCHNPHAQEQNNTFGTDYGKYVKTYICYEPKDIQEFVEFTSPTGSGSFADGPPHNANVCEMCHTETNHHQNDGTAPGGQSHYDGNNCTSCHPHIDGFAPTGGTPPPPHDTQDFIDNCDYCHVTATDFSSPIPDAKCEQCHSPAGALKPGFPTAPDVLTHSDFNGSGNYVYTNTCVDCHNPMVELPNLRFVRPDISNSIIPGSSVEFTAYSGAGSFADGPPHEENVCETCHSATNHHQYDGSAPGGQSHFDGTDCSSCHLHTKGFLPTCGACHDVPPAEGTHAVHFGGTKDDAGYGDTSIAQDVTAQGTVYLMNCGNCHPMNNANHYNGVPNSGGGSAEIELYNPDAPAGSLKSLSPSATYTPGDTLLTDAFGLKYTVGGSCDNVYCHSGPKFETEDPVTGAFPAVIPDPVPGPGPGVYPLTYDPPWQDFVVATRVYQSPRWGVDTLGCNGCHGYPISKEFPYVSAGAGDTHAWIDDYGYINQHVWNMGFAPLQCNVCHDNTVQDDFTWIRDDFSIQLGDITIFNTSKHVNGTGDVAFTPVPVVYPKSSGDVLKDLATATYDENTRTCSNVSCHLQQTAVEWGTPYRWWNGFECNICHRM